MQSKMLAMLTFCFRFRFRRRVYSVVYQHSAYYPCIYVGIPTKTKYHIHIIESKRGSRGAAYAAKSLRWSI